MYYGYSIPTKYGQAFCYTDEANIPATLPRNTLITLSNPSAKTKSSMRAVIVNPVSSSPFVQAVEYGETIEIPTEKLKKLEGQVIGTASITPLPLPLNIRPIKGEALIEIPIIMGKTISKEELPKGAKVTSIVADVPGYSPVAFTAAIITWIVVVALISATLIIVVGIPEIQKQRNIKHANDLIGQSQDIQKETLIMDGDVKETILKNGDVWHTAMNDEGYRKLGNKSFVLANEGWDGRDLFDPNEDPTEEEDKIGTYVKWGLIAAGGALLTYGAYKVLSKKRV